MKIRLPTGEEIKVYQHASDVFPSVTQILDVVREPWVEKWIGRVGIEEAQRRRVESLELGSRVHAIAESVAIYGCTPKLCRCTKTDTELWRFHQAVAHFLDTYVDEVLGIEMKLVSPELKLGGTIDLYVKLHDGSRAIIDYKTSKSITPKNGLQLIAYNILLHLSGGQATKRIAVQLRKDSPGEYFPKRFDDDPGDAGAFLALLQYWHWQYGPLLQQKLEASA